MKFTNLPEFLRYKDFEIEAQVGRHTVCKVCFTIAPEKVEDFLSAAEQRRTVEVSSNTGDCVMEGFVFEVAIEYGMTAIVANVKIISKSLLLQETGKERIFQNPKKTYADILKSFSEVEVGKCDHIQDSVEEIIYQHNVDDFSFLLYLANKCGTGLWITEEGNISFGMQSSIERVNDTKKVYQKSILEKKVTVQKGNRELCILTMEQFPNGSTIQYNQSNYVISHVHMHEKCDETYFQYAASTNPSFDSPSYVPEVLLTTAKVTANQDPDNLGRIQVKFLEFSDNDSEKIWIPYVTPFVGKNNGGVVMLPDTDDEVLICISDGKPYALGSLRLHELPENCKDIDKKQITVKDSIITIDDSEVCIKQGEKASCSIKSDVVTMVYDKAEITVNSDSIISKLEKSSTTIKSDSIKSESGKSTIQMNSNEIQCENGKAQCNLKQNCSKIIGGKSKLILDNGKTELTGSTIDLKN